MFGNVVEGMDVVDAIAQVPTATKGMYEAVPATPVVIKKATIASRRQAGRRRRRSNRESSRSRYREEAPPMANPTVALDTNHGTIVLELFPPRRRRPSRTSWTTSTPASIDGTLFHRVIPNFMIQGGGFDAQQRQKPTRAQVPNEADNGLTNQRGTIAMARTGDPHSATAQFFINLKDNGFLNHTGKNAQGWGYTVFGKVVEGMDVVDKIAKVRTVARARSPRPCRPRQVIIEKATARPVTA